VAVETPVQPDRFTIVSDTGVVNTEAKLEALAAVRVAAAHHRELIELAQSSDQDFSVAILDAGDCLDVALVLAHQSGAVLFELWGASKLPVQYLNGLINGIL
jgi:hypothetical protein